MVAADHLTIVDRCRGCGEPNLEQVLDLGTTPLADRLLHEPTQDVSQYPLHVLLCRTCSLVQLAETIAPQLLFDDDYPYLSSTSSSWLEHCRKQALTLMKDLSLEQSSLVIELASNDGYMLRNFHGAGIPVLGIEPSLPAYQAAQQAGIPTRNAFFDLALARQMRDAGQLADLVIAKNVLAHVPEPAKFASAMACVVKDNGMISIEVPYLPAIVQACAFDTIYHQHICYFSLHALQNLFTRAGLTICSVEKVSSQGGSLHILTGRNCRADASVKQMLEQELAERISQPDYFAHFIARITRLRETLPAVLTQYRSHGRTVAGYGAAAKGTTLLSHCGGAEHLDYLVDANRYKIGRYFPVGALPIYSVERLQQDPPDVLLLLAWNLEHEVRAQQHEFLQRGGEIIVPIPPERLKDHVA